MIDFSTFPRKASTILGLSFYNIIIRPLLKLYEKEKKISKPEHLNYFKEACKIAFRLWLQKEPNNTEPVKELIHDFLVNNNFHKLEEYEKTIYQEAAKRLYRNQNIPEYVTKLAKAKLPRILEITSKAPTHYIEGTIKNNILKKQEPDISEIKKNIALTIAQYILIQEMGGFDIEEIDKPDPEDLRQLIEYQQLYDLKIDIELRKHKDLILAKTEDIIKEIINKNKDNTTDNPILPTTLTNIINNVRNGMPQTNKEKWFMLECSMDKLETMVFNELQNFIKKRN